LIEFDYEFPLVARLGRFFLLIALAVGKFHYDENEVCVCGKSTPSWENTQGATTSIEANLLARATNNKPDSLGIKSRQPLASTLLLLFHSSLAANQIDSQQRFCKLRE
jgi:hypothetical protein